MSFVSLLDPPAVWKHFDALCAIPRGSKNEKAAGEYVVSHTRRLGLAATRDKAGNILIRKPASPGYEKRPTIALQSHLDMVCEKNAGTTHDFLRDPIVPRLDGDWLYATGTTLGADNGLGVACMCGLLEDPSVHAGPLELLFTVDEETGLNGALGLKPGVLSARRLLNLDGEDDGTFIIGCAGGAGVTLGFPLTYQKPPKAHRHLSVSVTGLRGGHSGIDIRLQRGNAIALLARAVFAAGEVRVVSLTGGNMRNAIPREAFAAVAVAANRAGAFTKAIDREAAAMRREYAQTDPDLRLAAGPAEVPDRILTRECGDRLLQLLRVLPHGVAAMSTRLPDLVESSSNLASVKGYGRTLSIHVSNRSSDEAALGALQDRVIAAARLSGCSWKEIEGYPGWNPDFESALLKTAVETYRSLNGTEPAVKAVHAGLECGIIGRKHPGMEMLSIGPKMEHPHSPDERANIPSVGRFYRFLTALLDRMG